MPWVYILQCKDGSYYSGSTPDLERRVAEHQQGEGSGYTSLRLPVRLVYSYEVARIEDAFYLERQGKGWRRAKKEALICGDYSALVELSRTARPSTGSPSEVSVRRADRTAVLRVPWLGGHGGLRPSQKINLGGWVG